MGQALLAVHDYGNPTQQTSSYKRPINSALSADNNNSLAMDISFDESPRTEHPISLDDVYEVIKTDEIIRPASLHGTHSFKFDLMNLVTGEMAVLFLNADKTKSGYKVTHNGKFAKIYRLTIGDNPKARYSKAEQLRGHFLGQHLKCKTELASYANGDSYMKAVEAKPLTPIIKAEWTATGNLIGKNRRCQPSQQAIAISPFNGNKVETVRKNYGNSLEKVWKNNGNDNTPQTTINNRPGEVFQSQITVQGNADNGRTVSRVVNSDSTSLYMTSNTLNGYDFIQMPEETQEQLYERLIEATF